MKTVKHIQQLILISLLTITSAVFAEANPQVIVQTATEQMMAELKNNRDKISEDKTIVNDIVEKILVELRASWLNAFNG